MEYPQEFIDAVKAEYPDNPFKLHERLDAGDTLAGRILDDSSQGYISPKDVKELSSDDLKLKADKIERRQNLYSQWVKLYQKQCLNRR